MHERWRNRRRQKQDKAGRGVKRHEEELDVKEENDVKPDQEMDKWEDKKNNREN